MKNKKNMYYGVSVDGLMLKVAEIEDNEGQLIVQRLQSYKLAKPLRSDFSDVSSEGDEFSSPNVTVKSPDDVDLEADVDDIDILSDSYGTDLDDMDINDTSSSAVQKTVSDGATTRKDIRESTAQTDGVYQFLGNFLFDSGKTSLSCIDGKVQWKQFRMSKKSSEKELKKRVLSDYQMRDPNCHVSFLSHADFNYTALIHQGDFELMTLLDRAGQMTFNAKKGLYYQYIEPIEISMLNLYNMFYSSEIGKYTTLLYIGEESRVGLVIKNKEIVKTFPLMVAGRDPEKIREAVMAKLLLEQENSDIPIIENILLAGSYATREDIEYYNKKTGHSHKLFELDSYEMKKYKSDLRIAGAVNPAEIPSYIVPVSLALHGAFSTNKEMNTFNLLPKRIIESHNPFNLKWYGILLVILIIITMIVGSNALMRNSYTLNELKTRLLIANNELNEKKEYIEQLDGYKRLLADLEESNTQTVNIASKNTWHIALERLSDFAVKNPMSWIENISLKDNNIILKGKSVQRERITNLSALFPNGHITRIAETKIADHDVWDFDINFPRLYDRTSNSPVLPLHLQSYENYVVYFQTQMKADLEASEEKPAEPEIDRYEPEVSEPIATKTPPPPPPTRKSPTPPPTEPTPPVAVTPPPAKSATPPAADTTPATPPVAVVTPPPVQPVGSRDKDEVAYDEYNDSKLLYDLARDSYLGNNFTDAITKLDMYVTKYPDGKEIALVYYLLGEINYVLNNFDKAVANFNIVYKLRKEKVAESLFFTAKSNEGMFDYDNAKKYYTMLIDEYPSNPLAKTADEQLKILNGEYQ